MEIALIIAFAILGVVIASFLNVCIDRLPHNKSLLFPASHCDSCHHHLGVKDLVPVFSYLWLRGRCRYCRAPIPKRVLVLEIVLGALFAYLYWQYGLSIELGIITYYCCLFIVLMVIDLEQGLILNKLVYPNMVVALLISAFLSPLEVVPEIKYSAMGGGIGLGLGSLVVIFSKGGMGWGDVKMAALIGLITGYPRVFLALILAAIFGGLIAGILLSLKKKKRKEGIPFGPALSIATIVTILWGTNIINWYLGLF